jgi:adenylosuccinate lyase
MKQNFTISKGLPMAESLMTTLIQKGMGRGEAHELMRKTALEAAQQHLSLKEAFTKQNKQLKILSSKEIDDALNPENYLGATQQIIKRVITKLDRK